MKVAIFTGEFFAESARNATAGKGGKTGAGTVVTARELTAKNAEIAKEPAIDGREVAVERRRRRSQPPAAWLDDIFSITIFTG